MTSSSNNFTISLDDYARLMDELIKRNNTTYYFELSLWTFLQLLTVIGNILTLKILLSNCSQRSSTNYLLASLTASDLCLSVLSNPLCHGVLFCSCWPYSEAFCQYQGVAALGLICVSTNHLVLMALNRYFCVLKRPKYDIYFSTKRTLVYIALSWVTSFILPIMYILSGRRYIFNPGKFFCYLKVDDVIFPILVCVIYIVIPSFIVDFCYFKVYKAIKSHNNSLQKWAKSSQTLTAQEINVTLILFFTVLLYYICSTPVLVIDFIDMFRQHWSFEREVYFVYTISASLIGFLNPIVYGIMNPVFKAEYKKILFKGKFWSKQKVLPCSQETTAKTQQ